VAHSQPSSAVGAAGSLQLLNPELQVELQRLDAQERDATFVEEHARPQSPHAVVDELTSDSHPSRSGDVREQSLNPDEQLAYVHVVPVVHAAPELCAVSQTFPHPAQLLVVVVAVSQPFVFGAVVMQSP
jgi:hypothetical protein